MERREKPKKKQPKWARGFRTGEQLYDMGIAQQEDVNIDDLDDDDLANYKKQAKVVSKSLKWVFVQSCACFIL